ARRPRGRGAPGADAADRGPAAGAHRPRRRARAARRAGPLAVGPRPRRRGRRADHPHAGHDPPPRPLPAPRGDRRRPRGGRPPRGLPPSRLRAARAPVHAAAERPEDTDWRQLAALYALLDGIAPGPMVTLNRAVAVAMVQGPEAGLAMLEPLDADPRMARHHRLASVRAHLLEQIGRASCRERGERAVDGGPGGAG